MEFFNGDFDLDMGYWQPVCFSSAYDAYSYLLFIQPPFPPSVPLSFAVYFLILLQLLCASLQVLPSALKKESWDCPEHFSLGSVCIPHKEECLEGAFVSSLAVYLSLSWGSCKRCAGSCHKHRWKVVVPNTEIYFGWIKEDKYI